MDLYVTHFIRKRRELIMEEYSQELDIRGIKEQVKNLYETVKRQDEMIKNTYNLAVEIKGLTCEMKTLREDIGEVKNDVATLKDKPAQRWESVVNQTITFVVGAILAYIVTKLSG